MEKDTGKTVAMNRTIKDDLRPKLRDVSALVPGERAHSGGQRLAGEVGRTAFGSEQEEATVLHDELEPFDALLDAPGNPLVAILERVTGWSPDQEGTD